MVDAQKTRRQAPRRLGTRISTQPLRASGPLTNSFANLLTRYPAQRGQPAALVERKRTYFPANAACSRAGANRRTSTGTPNATTIAVDTRSLRRKNDPLAGAFAIGPQAGSGRRPDCRESRAVRSRHRGRTRHHWICLVVDAQKNAPANSPKTRARTSLPSRCNLSSPLAHRFANLLTCYPAQRGQPAALVERKRTYFPANAACSRTGANRRTSTGTPNATATTIAVDTRSLR